MLINLKMVSLCQSFTCVISTGVVVSPFTFIMNEFLSYFHCACSYAPKDDASRILCLQNLL